MKFFTGDNQHLDWDPELNWQLVQLMEQWYDMGHPWTPKNCLCSCSLYQLKLQGLLNLFMAID